MNLSEKVGWTFLVIILGVLAFGLLREFVGAGHYMATAIEVLALYYIWTRPQTQTIDNHVIKNSQGISLSYNDNDTLISEQSPLAEGFRRLGVILMWLWILFWIGMSVATIYYSFEEGWHDRVPVLIAIYMVIAFATPVILRVIAKYAWLLVLWVIDGFRSGTKH